MVYDPYRELRATANELDMYSDADYDRSFEFRSWAGLGGFTPKERKVFFCTKCGHADVNHDRDKGCSDHCLCTGLQLAKCTYTGWGSGFCKKCPDCKKYFPNG